MKYFYNIFFFPLVWSFSTWHPVNNKNVQVSWTVKKANLISPILEISCSLEWKNMTHIKCYNIHVETMKIMFPNPFLTLAIRKAQEKNVSINVIDYNNTYVKLLWNLDDYFSDFVELRKN